MGPRGPGFETRVIVMMQDQSSISTRRPSIPNTLIVFVTTVKIFKIKKKKKNSTKSSKVVSKWWFSMFYALQKKSLSSQAVTAVSRFFYYSSKCGTTWFKYMVRERTRSNGRVDEIQHRHTKAQLLLYSVKYTRMQKKKRSRGGGGGWGHFCTKLCYRKMYTFGKGQCIVVWVVTTKKNHVFTQTWTLKTEWRVLDGKPKSPKKNDTTSVWVWDHVRMRWNVLFNVCMVNAWVTQFWTKSKTEISYTMSFLEQERCLPTRRGALLRVLPLGQHTSVTTSQPISDWRSTVWISTNRVSI